MSNNGNGHLNGHTNGNGHVHNGNGKHNINKNAHKGLSINVLQEAAVKADGSPTKMAKLLKVDKSTASHHLQKPEIKKAILTEREKALKKAGLTRVRAYKRVNEALDANIISWGAEKKDGRKKAIPDHDVRLKAAKLTAELYGDINPKDTSQDGAKNIFNFFIPIKDTLKDIVDAEIA